MRYRILNMDDRPTWFCILTCNMKYRVETYNQGMFIGESCTMRGAFKIIEDDKRTRNHNQKVMWEG
jgi:hypothetical protein